MIFTQGPYTINLGTARVEITQADDHVPNVVGAEGYFAMKRLELIVHRDSETYGSGDACIASVYMYNPRPKDKNAIWTSTLVGSRDVVCHGGSLAECVAISTTYLMQYAIELAQEGK